MKNKIQQKMFIIKTELTAKLIQHLNLKHREKGFTLVELLVVIIIIGILAAIALPNFLNQSAKAKQTEAKQNIGIANRYQTVHRSENNGFADTFDKLGAGVLSGNTGTANTTNYSYSMTGVIDNYSLIATAQDASLKAYSGGSSIYVNSESKTVIASVVCEALVPSTTLAVAVVNSLASAPTCPASGYQQLVS
jgi:type IV pilus assembly protein PilA